MSLKETYIGILENVKKMNPDAEFIIVTRSAGHILSPSWKMLAQYKEGVITWDEYVKRFIQEMNNDACRKEMLRIGELAKTKDVFLVCFERIGNCHRFLLMDMIPERQY